MPIEHVYIARVIDGLILVCINIFVIFCLVILQVASMEQGGSGGSNEKMELFKSQVKVFSLL
jgi:hypothetical protein